MARMVKVTAYECDDGVDLPLSEFVRRITENVPAEYAGIARIKVYALDEVNASVDVTYERPETAEDAAARERQEAAWAAARRQAADMEEARAVESLRARGYTVTRGCE